ncbi:MAG: amidohydrolase family protein [Leptospiraceae bacterium]|nr:amidohydrolase family protein [Leptospiraceae bacterium]
MKILLFLSLFGNVLFLAYQIPYIQIKMRFLLFGALGFSVPKNVPYVKKNVLVTEFYPISMLEMKDIRLKNLPTYPVFEMHGHLGFPFQKNPEEVTKLMDELKIVKMINLSFKTGEEFQKIKSSYNDPRIIHFSTFNWKRIDERENFIPLMLDDLKKDISVGSKGIKLWKNFGLMLKKRNGERLKMNDSILDPLFQECAKHNLPIFIHTVDPKSFFSPIDEKNERYDELVRRPEWSFASNEYPSFDEVLQERDELFGRHPNVKFVALHFAEYSHNLQKADKLLTSNKNVYIDISARIDELGRQPYSAKKFFEKFQDRIFFGTDGPPDRGKYEIYSRFLETKDEYFDYYPFNKPRKGLWKIYGLGLSPEVLKKIYYENANTFFGKIGVEYGK